MNGKYVFYVQYIYIVTKIFVFQTYISRMVHRLFMENTYIWIIESPKNRNIIGCFMEKEDAEKYIDLHQLECILTHYPIDISVYDWVIGKQFWQPKNEVQKTGKFIANFSSAYLEHEHFNQEDLLK